MTEGEMAKGLFLKIQTDIPAGFDIPANKRPRVENELTYLSMFVIDLGVYLAVGDTRERNQIMDDFWSLVSDSGMNTQDLGSRLQAYSDAARADNEDLAFDNLGNVFAWHCLAQENKSIARAGSQVAQSLLAEVTLYVKQHSLVR